MPGKCVRSGSARRSRRPRERRGEAVAGAKIVIAETGETFFADMDGYYKLEVKTDKAYSITVNTIGYQPAEYKSNSLGTFTDLSLQEL